MILKIDSIGGIAKTVSSKFYSPMVERDGESDFEEEEEIIAEPDGVNVEVIVVLPVIEQ